MIVRSFLLLLILSFVICSRVFANPGTVAPGQGCIATTATPLPDELGRQLVASESKNLSVNWLKSADFQTYKPSIIEFHFSKDGLITTARLEKSTGSISGDFSCMYAVLTSTPVEIPRVAAEYQPSGFEFSFDQNKLGQPAHFSKKLLAKRNALVCPLIPPAAIKKYGCTGLQSEADDNCALISKTSWKSAPERIQSILMEWQNFYKKHPKSATNSELQTMASMLRSKLSQFH